MKTENPGTVETGTNVETKKKFRIPAHWVAIGAFVVIFGVFVAFTVGFGGLFGDPGYRAASSLSKDEMALIVKDMNPMQLRMLSENEEQRKNLANEVRRMLAIAREAEREGLAKEESVQAELRFIETAILANNYDQKSNEKNETAAQPFASVTDEQVKAFWEAKDENAGEATPESREKSFKEFIDAKLTLAKESGQMAEDAKPSDEELEMAKGIFAKTQLTYLAAKKKLASLATLPAEEQKEWKEFEKSVSLQIKLQQSQFLAQLYGQRVLSKKLEVTEAEVDRYLAENPELGDLSKKKATAQEVLKKLNEGGDFAELAKEYSEDPGSKDNGVLYEDVPPGQMDPVFEKAALSLEPGAYTKEPVETQFGFHIIKLENKTEGEDGKPAENYSVRHILISTQISDPQNPMARPMSARNFAKSKLGSEKEKKLLDEILARNPVSVPTDFEIPKPSEEDIKKMLEQQRPPMQAPPPQPGSDAPQQ